MTRQHPTLLRRPVLWIQIHDAASCVYLGILNCIGRLVNREKLLLPASSPWVFRKETTRIKDTAYFLLGIFGGNMLLLS